MRSREGLHSLDEVAARVADLFLPNLVQSACRCERHKQSAAKSLSYLERVGGDYGTGMRQSQVITQRRHRHNAYALAVVTNSQLGGICGELHQSDTRSQRHVGFCACQRLWSCP